MHHHKSIASRRQSWNQKIRLRHRLIQRTEELRIRQRSVCSTFQLRSIQQVNLFHRERGILHLRRCTAHHSPYAAEILGIFGRRRRLQPAHVVGLHLGRQAPRHCRQRVSVRRRHLRLRRAHLSRGNTSHQHSRRQQPNLDSHHRARHQSVTISRYLHRSLPEPLSV